MVRLRKATESDMPLIMAWRSSPLVFEGFFSQKQPLTWDEHKGWWESRNKDWREFVIQICDDKTLFWRDVGIVTIGQLDHWNPEIGYALGEVSLWGKGVGREAVRQAMEWLKQFGKEYCHTTVKLDNKRSIELLKGLGFKELGEAREGEIWMTKQLT